MTHPTEIIESLEQQGLINKRDSTTAIELLGEKDDSTAPWFVQVLTGVGAWVSAFLFLIAFVFGIGGDLLDDEIAISIFGAVLLIAVFVIAKTREQPISIFLDQILLSMSLLAHVLFVMFFAHQQDNPELWIGIMIIPLSLCFIFFYPNRIHTFLSTGGLVGGIYLLAIQLGIMPLGIVSLLFLAIAVATTWMWLNESRFLEGKKQAIVRPVQYALIPIFLIGCSVVEQLYRGLLYYRKYSNSLDFDDFSITHYFQFISAGLFFILAYVIVTILKRLNIEWKSLISIVLLMVALCLSVLFHQSPSILASIIVLLIGIERGNKLLVPIAVIALISFYSYYYYNLDMTLMTKSFILMAAGCVMLIAGWLTSKIGGKT